ncbi:MAG: DUF5615 family PIN-like protein [Planctomycetes bacterium]|nr:DUF5615 family PIN-like protein [Planctomycetota bacterium]
MKFLIDAQLPRRAVDWFGSAGCDGLHTLDLPEGNRTTDQTLIEVGDREQRAVMTKDADFVSSHVLQGRPAKLLGFDREHQQPRARNIARAVDAGHTPRIPDALVP